MYTSSVRGDHIGESFNISGTHHQSVVHELKLYSLHRHRERYIIIFFWKATQHFVPTIDGTTGQKIETRKQHPIHGTHAVLLFSIQLTETQRNPFKKMQYLCLGIGCTVSNIFPHSNITY